MKKILIIAFIVCLTAGSIYYVSSQKKMVRNKPVTQITPTTITSTTDKNFDEKDLGFSLSLPSNFIAEKNGQFSRLYYKENSQTGVGPRNFLYISVIPKGKENVEGEIYNYNQKDLNTLQKLEVGKSAVMGDAEANNLAEYFTYTRIDGEMVGGYGVTAFINKKPWEFPSGTTEYRYIIPFEQATYLVGAYTSVGSSSDGSITKEEFDEVIKNLRLTPETVTTAFTSPAPEGEWKKFSDPQAGISFEYPSAWTQRKESQSFPEGDLFSLFVSGQTQRPQTELYDGVMFAVMKPLEFTADIKAWMKERYQNQPEMDSNNPPKISEVSFGGYTYEKIKVCGLGCFTYYHIDQNGKLYGFVTMAVGPNETVYEAAVSRILSSVKY